METLEKCWQVKECGKTSECIAFPHFGHTCWMIRRELGSVLGGEPQIKCETECETCEVYQWHMALTNFILQRRSPSASA